MNVLSYSYGIIMDREINAPGHIKNFFDVRKYHLDLRNISFDVVNITKKDIRAHTE